MFEAPCNGAPSRKRTGGGDPLAERRVGSPAGATDLVWRSGWLFPEDEEVVEGVLLLLTRVTRSISAAPAKKETARRRRRLVFWFYTFRWRRARPQLV